jgi:hypothetical protein
MKPLVDTVVKGFRAILFEIAALFERIELRIGDVDRESMDAAARANAMVAHGPARLFLAGVSAYRPVVIDH